MGRPRYLSEDDGIVNVDDFQAPNVQGKYQCRFSQMSWCDRRALITEEFL